MNELIMWGVSIPVFALSAAKMHKHRVGPLRAMTRGLIYARAGYETTKESCGAFGRTWRTTFVKNLEVVKRTW